MDKPRRGTLVELVRRCGPEAVLRAAALCDGHTIFDPQAFVRAGLPPEVVEHLTDTHRSDGTPKGTVFTNGQAVPEVRGVYGLDVLRFLAAALGVEYRSALGRGFPAEHIRQALRRHLAGGDLPPAA